MGRLSTFIVLLWCRTTSHFNSQGLPQAYRVEMWILTALKIWTSLYVQEAHSLSHISFDRPVVMSYYSAPSNLMLLRRVRVGESSSPLAERIYAPLRSHKVISSRFIVHFNDTAGPLKNNFLRFLRFKPLILCQNKTLMHVYTPRSSVGGLTCLAAQ